MPIEYNIDPELGIVNHEFTGEIFYKDFEAYWRRFLSEPNLPEPLVMLADLRNCELRVDGEDVQRLARTVIEPLLGDRRWISAVIVASNVEYGVTKQFIVYSARFGETEVFRDAGEAIRWLVERMEARKKDAG